MQGIACISVRFIGVEMELISVGGGAIRLFYACLEACEGDRGLDRF